MNYASLQNMHPRGDPDTEERRDAFGHAGHSHGLRTAQFDRARTAHSRRTDLAPRRRRAPLRRIESTRDGSADDDRIHHGSVEDVSSLRAPR